MNVSALALLLVQSGLIGVAMPPLVAIIIRVNWASWVKAAVALGTSAAVGTGTAWAAGELNGVAWPAAILAALVATELAYRTYWHPKGIAPAIERATSPSTGG